MVVTAVEEAKERGGLRPMEPTRDLGVIADLISDAFANELDERGQAALREMRWMARLTPLVWWWSQVDPSFRDAFNGFVWEEPTARAGGSRSASRIVGNANLNRAPGNRQRWIICNVVVLEAYRGQGIGRRLMEAAIEEAQQIGAAGVVLQVHRDNPRALGLYTNVGFHEVSGETDLRLEAVGSVAFLDAPGYEIRRWSPADGQAVYDLARQAMPAAQQWIRPVRAEEYRLDWLLRLGHWISDLAGGRRSYRLTALKDDRLVAAMTVTAVSRKGAHWLALLVHPGHRGKVEAALVSRALYMLASAPPRPVRITANVGDEATLKILRDYGFKEQRTLLTLRKDFTEDRA
jgi:ribosomal protein S18 acetylase RimI-like enzyme